MKHLRDQPITGFVVELGDLDGPRFASSGP
jgi:hypothetical protein